MQQKLLLLIITICTIITMPCFAANSKNKLSNIEKSEKQIQEILNISGLTIEDYIPYDTIYSIYEKQCDEKIIQEAQKTIDTVTPIRSNWIKSSKYISTMKQRFSLFKNLLFSQNSKWEDFFCKKNYLSYHVMELSQNAYIKKTNKNLIIPKSNLNTDSNAITQNIKEHNSAISDIKLNNNTDILSESELRYSTRAEELIQNEIINLVNMNLLNQNDLNTLNNNITINYSKSCENTKWSFHILKSKDWLFVQFKSIILNINLCNSDNFRKNYDNYIKQIFIHEISHYIYTFKDNYTDNFSQICRNSKKSCTIDSFVSDYSTNNTAEDYAETFAYRYLDNFNWVDKVHWSSTNKFLTQKLNYFNQLIQLMN